jgi:hypothetical protein
MDGSRQKRSSIAKVSRRRKQESIHYFRRLPFVSFELDGQNDDDQCSGAWWGVLLLTPPKWDYAGVAVVLSFFLGWVALWPFAAK